jgi:hypothetical protein
VRPVRVVGREADIVGQRAYASINELYGSQEKYLLLELEVPAGLAGAIAQRDRLYGWQIGTDAAEGFTVRKAVVL